MNETRIKLTTTNTGNTTHAPLTLAIKVEFVLDSNGEVAGTVIEWTASPAPHVIALTD